MKKFLKNALFLIVFWLLIYYIQSSGNKIFNKEIDDLKLKGKIIRKYIDNNDHNREKITILEKNDTTTLDLANESSGIFNFVQIGDSIHKSKNKRFVQVKNDIKDSTFIISF